MLVSYRLSIVTLALPLTVQPQFSIRCLRRSVRQGWVTFVKILGCSVWSTSLKFKSAESEHPGLSNREIIFEDFQPMRSSDTSTSRTAVATPRSA